MMKSISRQMAEFALGLRFEEIPAAVVQEAKRFLLDSVGCAMAAVQNEDMLSMHHYINALGGPEEATIIGSGHRTGAANAGLMNSLLIRALDYNDIYWEEDPSHPSDMIGIALSSGEASQKSGKDVLIAILIAYELEMRWCHAARPGIREIGWHHASLTQFVSPLVAGRLFGLTEDEMVAAVGISGSSHFTLGGVVAGHLTHMKNTADPLAAQAGIQAAMMAKAGVKGPVEVLEGKEGLFEVLNQVSWHPQELIRELGRDFMLPRCSYKAFPTEALTHQPISAAIQVCTENNLVAEDIAAVRVETTTRGADILSDPSKYEPNTKETADHSLPYVIAAAIADGNVLPGSFEDQKLFDPRIRNLLPKIEVVADPEIDRLFPGVKRARVQITTIEGTTFFAQVDDAKGSPKNPMSDDELIAKFKANAEHALSAAQQEQVIEETLNFEKIANLTAYMQQLVCSS